MAGQVSPVPLDWRTSTFSGGGDCVGAVVAADGTRVRNSRAPEDAELSFTRAEWDAFVLGVKNDEFDPPRVQD